MIRGLLIALALLLGCGGGEDHRRVVTLWHAYAGAEKDALDEVARRFNDQSTDVRVRLVSVPYDAFPDKISASIPNGNGPDLFVFAHDRIGDWAGAGLIEPVEFFVDEALADGYDTQAISSLAYRGSLYGLPLAVKSVALFYRTDLVTEPPRTTDDMVALGRRLTDRAAGRYGLAYENTSLYFHAPWVHGFGGRLFDDEGHLTLADAASVRALAFARDLGGPDGIVPQEMTSSLVGTLFAEGKAAMAISGPWFIGQLPAGVPWKVTSMPIVSATGRPAAPFLGTEGVLMSARARDKAAAFRVMAWLAADESAVHRAVTARQVVPNRAAYADPRIGGDAVLAAFREQARVAEPTPSTPEMQMVWTPYMNAIQKVVGQGADPAAALGAAHREVEEYMR